MSLKSNLKEARDAIKAKDFKSALKLSKAILKEDRNNYMGLIFLGVSIQEVGPAEQAPNAFKKAIQANAENILAWNGLANYYEKVVSPEGNIELLKVYGKIINLESNESKTLEVLNKIVELKLGVHAIKVFEEIVKNEKLPEVVKTEGYKAIIVSIGMDGNVPDDLLDIYETSLIAMIENEKTQSVSYYSDYLKLLYKQKKYETLFNEAEKMHLLYHKEVICLEWMCKAFNELYIEGDEEIVSLVMDKVKIHYEILMELDGTSSMGLFTKAVLLFEDKKFLDVREVLGEVTLLRPKLLHAWILTTKCFINLQLFNDALDAARKAELIVKTTNNCNTALLNILQHVLCHSLSESSEMDDCEQAKNIALTVLTETPNNIDFIKYAIQAFINLKDYVEADMWLHKLSNLDPKLFAFMKTKLLLSRQNFNDALKILEANVYDGDSLYWLLTGDTYWGLELFEKTLAPYLKAAKLDPNSYLCFYNLGKYYQKVGDLDKSRRCYEKCIKINRKFASAGIELSKIYRKEKKWDDNLNLLKNSAAKIDSNTKWAHLQLGVHYLEKEDYNEAINVLRLVTRADPLNGHCWESLADAYYSRGAYTSALKCYQRTMELMSNAIYPMLQVANIKKILGDYEEARAEFEAVLAINRKYIPALKGVAETCLYQSRQYYRQQLHGLARGSAQYAVDKLTIALTESSELSCLWKLVADCTYLVTLLPAKYSCLSVAAALAEGKNEDRHVAVLEEELCYLTARCLCKAINLTDENILIYHDLACCYLGHAKKLPECEQKVVLLDRALAAIQYCVDKNETYWQHWNLMGNIAFAKEPKDLALAQHAFIMAVTLEHNSSIAWSNLGSLYLFADHVKLANEAFSQAQRTDPNNVNSWVGQALIAEAAGHEDAMDLFRHSTQLGFQDQGAIGYAYWVCKTLMESPPDEVIYSIHNMHAVPVACDAMTWYTENDPYDACSWNMLGMLQERMGLKLSASRTFQRTLKLAQDGNKDAVRVNYGRSLYALGRYQEAVKEFKGVKEATFNSGSGLALALFKDELYEESYEAYESALHWLTENPGFQSDLLVALASMAYLFQGAEAAKTLLFQSIQLKSRSLWSLYATLSLGLANNDLNLVQLVLKELESLKDDSDCLPHYGVLLSISYLMQGENTKAVRELSKLVHRHPDQAQLWLSLSILLLQLHSVRPVTSAAASCARAAMRLGQAKMDVSKILCIVSLASSLAGNTNDALKAAQSAIHLYPDVAEGWSVLIYALKDSGKNCGVTNNFIVDNLNPTASLLKWLNKV